MAKIYSTSKIKKNSYEKTQSFLIIYQVPPTLNQFNTTVNRDQTKALFKLLKKYAPETKKEKKARLLEKA